MIDLGPDWLWFLLVFVFPILGIWKLIEIVVWLFSNVSVSLGVL